MLNKLLLAGASLVQVYTGFIYNGPTLLNRINRYLSNNEIMLKYSEKITKTPEQDKQNIAVSPLTREEITVDVNSGASFHE